MKIDWGIQKEGGGEIFGWMISAQLCQKMMFQ